jgi:FkbM family methyltransferase
MKKILKKLRDRFLSPIMLNDYKIIEQNDSILKHLEYVQINNENDMIYAYRYLLNRDPENWSIVENNVKDWKELREEFINSKEYVITNSFRMSNNLDVYTTLRNLEEEIRNGSGLNYELELETTYRKLISEGDDVIDIGAHMGRHLKVFQSLVGEKGNVYGFEPLPKQYDYLISNFSSSNITLINEALSNQSGKMEFYEVENYPEESGLQQRQYNNNDARVNIINVDVNVLDNYMDRFGNLKYIKLDAEGAELHILQGGLNCIQKHRPFISIEYGYPSYNAFGLKKESLYNFTVENNYYITDVFGNVILNIDIWNEVCDSVYWDFILVPIERIKEFLLKIHS